jgi:hypothetical protein
MFNKRSNKGLRTAARNKIGVTMNTINASNIYINTMTGAIWPCHCCILMANESDVEAESL